MGVINILVDLAKNIAKNTGGPIVQSVFETWDGQKQIAEFHKIKQGIIKTNTGVDNINKKLGRMLVAGFATGCLELYFSWKQSNDIAEQIQSIVEAPFQIGTDHLRNAQNSSDIVNKIRSIEKASDSFIEASKLLKSPKKYPFGVINSKLFIGLCQELLGEPKVALNYYVESYNLGIQLWNATYKPSFFSGKPQKRFVEVKRYLLLLSGKIYYLHQYFGSTPRFQLKDQDAIFHLEHKCGNCDWYTIAPSRDCPVCHNPIPLRALPKK